MRKTSRVSVRIAAPPERVFEALTTSDQLEAWFAEDADVSLSDLRYDFWGRSTPENPDRETGRHRVLSLDEGRRFSFEWRLRDTAAIVELTVTPDGDETVAEVRHTSGPARPGDDFSMADFWSVALENLRGWVERRVVGARCDFGTPQHDGVTIEVEIDAPAQTVFAALTVPAQLDRYVAQGAIVEPHVGGRYSFGWDGVGPIKIVELVPDQKLAYEWNYEEEHNTLVTWTLEGSGDHTRLMLRHSGFVDGNQEGYRNGWMNSVNRVKFLSEVGDRWVVPTVSEINYETAEVAVG